MSPWDMVAALGIYTDEQVDEMTWAECEEILNQDDTCELDRSLIILALQTLLEQVKDTEDQTYADRINREITKLQNYEI